MGNKNVFLIKYAEIGLKGKNRDIFEKLLVKNIVHALRNMDPKPRVVRPSGRIFVEFPQDAQIDREDVIEALSKVFGISGISPVMELEDCEFEELATAVVSFLKEEGVEGYPDFKVNARRSRKNYPMDSMEINRELGDRILTAFPDLKVNVHAPSLMVHVEVRERISVYVHEVPGLRGMPRGSSGKSTLLLSGGIDSPVAGYLMAKRGITLDAVYFHAPPYTSERALKKVVDLAKKVSVYAGAINLYTVNFTDIQMAIYQNAPHDQLTIIMRRYMMKIAEHFARESGSLGLITGESMGQVASQTLQSLMCTDDATTLPVYRPLIGMDKQEIIERAQKIDTYETSILPFEDCCTIFVAKHPVTKPRLDVIKRSEDKIAEIIAPLYEQAISTVEITRVDES